MSERPRLREWFAPAFPIAAWLFTAGVVCTPAETARDIIVKSVNVDHVNARVASQYVYQEREVTKDLDSAGNVKKTKIVVREMLFVGGKPYEHVLEKDGKPLPPDEARKEQAKLDKAVAEAARLSDEERARRLAELDLKRAKQREQLKPIPDAYDFTLLGEKNLGGRDVFVIQANPRPSYHGPSANLLRNLRGRIYIDKRDYAWVRVEAEVLENISWGLFLAKVAKGGHFNLEQTRVNDEVWLPKTVEVRVSARALVNRFNVEEEVTYGNYRKFQTSARMTGVTAESK